MNVFEQPVYLWALFVVPGVYIAWRYLNYLRESRLHKFVDTSQWRRLASTVWHKARTWRLRLAILAIALCVLAMAGPQYGTEVMEIERMGADIVVALDISRSMLAEDFRPTRLDEAKRAVLSLLRGLKGDRVGLVAFSGAATIMCPLTSDYNATELFLSLAKPGYIPQPGTNIGDALELSVRLLQKSDNRDKAVILITDGEDHAGKIEEKLPALMAVGAKVYAVGIGSPEGTLIPEFDASGALKGYHRDRAGEIVQTRLEAGTLQSIAQQTGGQFFQADPSGRSVEDVLVEIGALQKGAYAEHAMYRYKNRYTWPLAGALLALFGFMILWERRGDPRL